MKEKWYKDSVIVLMVLTGVLWFCMLFFTIYKDYEKDIKDIGNLIENNEQRDF